MKKNNVKIKDNINIIDEIAVIESIVSSYFTNGKYTPYYADMAKVIAIAENFLDGVEFDEEDYDYDLVMTNDDIYKLVKKFLYSSVNKSDSVYFSTMESIMNQVEDIVDFEKQKIIHNTESFSILGDMCIAIKDILDNYSKNAELAKTFMEDLQKSGITEESLVKVIRKAADQFKLPSNDVIEGQGQRIAEQQQQLKEKEAEIQELRAWKREYMARNVKSTKRTESAPSKTSKKKTAANVTQDSNEK